MCLLLLSDFLYFWGLTFVVVTTLVALFKKETSEKYKRIDSEVNVKMDIIESYNQLWQIIKLPSIRALSVILLTAKVYGLVFIIVICGLVFIIDALI